MDQQKIDAIAPVTRNGCSLASYSVELKDDKEVVLAAVTKNGFPLKYASEHLRNDKDIGFAAVTQSEWGLQYASGELKDNSYFLYKVDQIKKINIDSNIFNCISERIQEEIKKDPDYLSNFAPVNLKPAKMVN
jgi:hypothetical protein